MSVSTAAPDLFDPTGRRVPPAGLSGAVNKADRRYILVQPALDYPAIHARLSRHLKLGAEISAGEFAERAGRLLAAFGGRGAAAGVHVPFLIPKTQAPDLGRSLEETFLPALAESYREKFPKYRFVNELKGRLAGQLRPARGGRHEALLAALAKGPVVGVYFPACLTGFSFDACREQMATLPEAFMLAGGFDAAAALIGSPDLCMRVDGYAPQLDLPGLDSATAGFGCHFVAYGYDLTFNGRHHNALASDYCAGGLTILG